MGLQSFGAFIFFFFPLVHLKGNRKRERMRVTSNRSTWVKKIKAAYSLNEGNTFFVKTGPFCCISGMLWPCLMDHRSRAKSPLPWTMDGQWKQLTVISIVCEIPSPATYLYITLVNNLCKFQFPVLWNRNKSSQFIEMTRYLVAVKKTVRESTKV